MRTSTPVPHQLPSIDRQDRRAAATTACGNARAWIQEFADGTLHDAVEDPTWIVAHLAACETCARIAHQLRAQRARLRDLATRARDESERAPASLVARVLAAFAQHSA